MNKLLTIVLLIVAAGLILYAAPSVFSFLSASLSGSGFNLNGSVFYYSFDAGDSFLKNSQGLAFGEINDLIFAPDKSIFAATNQGLFKTAQPGEKWERVIDETGFLRSPISAKQIAFLNQNSSDVLVAASKSNFGRIYRSTDGLKSLKEVYSTSNEGATITGLKFNSRKSRVYFISTEGVFGYSDNAGGSFRLLKQFPDPLQKIVFDSANDQNIFIISRQSLYKSSDAGYSFVDLSDILTASGIAGINDLWLNKEDGLFLASDSGAWRSSDFGYTWQKLDSLLPEGLPATAIMYNDERGEALIGFGGRLYTSFNGYDWSIRSLNQSNTINIIRINPLNSNVILVGMKR